MHKLSWCDTKIGRAGFHTNQSHKSYFGLVSKVCALQSWVCTIKALVDSLLHSCILALAWMEDNANVQDKQLLHLDSSMCIHRQKDVLLWRIVKTSLSYLKLQLIKSCFLISDIWICYEEWACCFFTWQNHPVKSGWFSGYVDDFSEIFFTKSKLGDNVIVKSNAFLIPNKIIIISCTAGLLS